jgi:hypothetical protein
MDLCRSSRARRSAATATLQLLAATVALSTIHGCGSNPSGNNPDGADAQALACTDLAAACAANGRCATPLATAIAQTCADDCGPLATQPCSVFWAGLVEGPTQTFIDWSRADSHTRYAYDTEGNLVGVVSYSTMTTPAWSCGGLPGFDPTEAMTVPAPGSTVDETAALRARCSSTVDAGTD